MAQPIAVPQRNLVQVRTRGCVYLASSDRHTVASGRPPYSWRPGSIASPTIVCSSSFAVMMMIYIHREIVWWRHPDTAAAMLRHSSHHPSCYHPSHHRWWDNHHQMITINSSIHQSIYPSIMMYMLPSWWMFAMRWFRFCLRPLVWVLKINR